MISEGRESSDTGRLEEHYTGGNVMFNGFVTYLRNIGLLLNHAVVTLIGKDPGMTISAVAYQHDWKLQRLINRLYGDKNHCRDAAQGWVDPETREPGYWAKKRNRSLW